QHGGEEWDGYSFEWNDDETDAFLLETSKTKPIVIHDASAPGGETIHNYYFPSRDDCNTCHTAAAGYVLGVHTAQLNGEYQYGEIVDHQLRSLNHIRMFTGDIGEDYHEFPALANPADESKSLEDRARSYLDANCSQCHRPQGTGRAGFDLRASTPLVETQLLDLTPIFGDLGTQEGRIVKPASPENSVLYLRMTRTDGFRMPPLATSIVDELGARVVHDWIQALQDPTSVADHHSTLPTEFKLDLAFPNPFNPATTITFEVPRAERVSVTIFNITGQQVKEIVNDHFGVGRHSVTWQGEDESGRTVASGVYIYAISAGSFQQSQKILLLK
ncbi:MAG TPA: T9SS type A sorting domain-containing protein, partial [bacterium]